MMGIDWKQSETKTVFRLDDETTWLREKQIERTLNGSVCTLNNGYWCDTHIIFIPSSPDGSGGTISSGGSGGQGPGTGESQEDPCLEDTDCGAVGWTSNKLLAKNLYLTLSLSVDDRNFLSDSPHHALPVRDYLTTSTEPTIVKEAISRQHISRLRTSAEYRNFVSRYMANSPYPNWKAIPVIAQPVDTVHNQLVNICMDSAFKKVTADTIKALLKKVFNNTFVAPESPFMVTIKEGANLTSGGKIVPAYTVRIDSLHWEIVLNNTYFTKPGDNMSQEGWGQIIIHEMLHTFIRVYLPEITDSNLDHVSIFRDWATMSKQFLQEAFGMQEGLALRLALSGIKDNWKYSNFDSLSVAKYGVGLTSIDSTFDAYTKGGLGRKCN